MKILALVLLCAMLAAPAYAGKNAGGALIVHTNDANNYTFNICDRFETVDNPGTCENAGTQTNKPDDQTALVWLITEFPPSTSPGVSVIYFGLVHNLPPGQGYIENWGFCGPAGSIEVPDAGWPDQGGNAVGFSIAIVGDTFFPFYYLNAYGFAGAFLGTGVNPTGGYAAFVDDSNPPIQDDIFRFGVVRWGTPGSNDCFCCGGGACCFPDGGCLVELLENCEAMGGQFQGDGTNCDLISCTQPEACCFADCHCENLLTEDCIAQGGSPQGLGTDCATTECPCPPPIGACCFCDYTCQDLTEADCLAQGGMFFGPGTDCATIQCAPPPPGACCLGHECLIMSEWCCILQNGEFEGVGTECDPNPCEATPTRSTTWGRIKSSFK